MTVLTMPAEDFCSPFYDSVRHAAAQIGAGGLAAAAAASAWAAKAVTIAYRYIYIHI